MGIRSLTSGLAFTLLGVSLAATVAVAADLSTPVQPPDDGSASAFFGNLHAGVQGRNESSNNGTNIWPTANLGGKFSYEPVGSLFGLQMDMDENAFMYNWETNGPPSSGGRIDSVGALHGTYDLNDNTKIGVYGSLTNQYHDLSAITNPAYSYGGRTNLASSTFVRTDGVVGVEGMYMFQPTAWVEGHAGLTNNLGWGRSWTDATTGVTTFGGVSTGQPIGYQIGGDVRYGITPNFSVRGDVNYNVINFVSGYDNNFTALATAQYAFDNTPLAMFGQIGYLYGVSASSNYTDYSAKVGFVYSFGGVTSTTRGKLFHTAGTTGTID